MLAQFSVPPSNSSSVMEKMETITLRPGENHLVNLPGLGSAGYRWMLDSCDQHVGVVEEILHSKRDVAPKIAGSLDQTFKLSAVAPGRSSVRFVQRRRFEPGKEPHASYELSLLVTG